MSSAAKEVNVDVAKFWKDGYLLLRDVFKREEILNVRKGVYDSPSLDGDLLSNPRLRHLLLDDRILNTAAKLLGQTPIYFGESTVKRNFGGAGWHRDNVDREDPTAPDWQGRYTIIKFGIYSQDHSKHSGGINIRAGSHEMPPLVGPPEKVGVNHYMATRPGDVVIWTIRTTHSARGFQLKFPKFIQVEPSPGPRLPHSIDFLGRFCRFIGVKRFQNIPRFMIAPEEGERILIVLTFAIEDAHFKRYLSWLKTRKFMVDLWKNSDYGPEVFEAVKGKNVILKNYWPEFKNDSGLGLENFDYDDYKKVKA